MVLLLIGEVRAVGGIHTWGWSRCGQRSVSLSGDCHMVDRIPLTFIPFLLLAIPSFSFGAEESELAFAHLGTKWTRRVTKRHDFEWYSWMQAASASKLIAMS